MGRRLGYAAVAIFLMSGLPLAAQQPPSKGQASDTANQTLTGCVRTLRAGTGAADPKGNIYTLEVMDTPSVGTTEVGAPAPGTSGPITYTLSAPDAVSIGKHVGHQVQLTGKLQPPAANQSPASGTQTTAAKKPGQMHRTFEVSALRMISAKCP